MGSTVSITHQLRGARRDIVGLLSPQIKLYDDRNICLGGMRESGDDEQRKGDDLPRVDEC